MKVAVKSILFLFFIHVLTACAGGGESAKDNDVIVNVAQAKVRESGARKEFSFISKPYRTSELSFRVGGPIDRFDVYAGNYYKQGGVIAEIDSRDFSIRKERAEAVYNQAKAEFERIEALYGKKNVSASAYEKAKADCTTAKMAFRTAANELDDTKLTAPFDGYAGEVYIEKHQDVKAAQPVISLVDIDRLKIEVYVTQDIAFNSGEIKNINLRFDAKPGEIYSAQVVEISRSTTKNNLSYLLTALLPNKDGKLLAGMSGKVFFDVARSAASPEVTIPQTALCHRPAEGDYVWVVNTATGQVSHRKVVFGSLLPNGVAAVSEGIEAGETVAVSGLRFLSEGMRVKTVQTVAGQRK